MKNSNWQPIETAPCDGTRFLGLTKKGYQRVDWFNGPSQGEWNERSLFWHERPMDRYTHWMPLPAPPEAKP